MHGTWDETKDLMYHKGVQSEGLVYSIGGGIGIDRLNKWLLGKKHIGEVQVSTWPEQTYKENPNILK